MARDRAGKTKQKEFRNKRAELIVKIEELRQSRVIAYVCSDRPGAAAQIGEDAVRPMYDHLLPMGKQKQIDLFLYSRGGAVEVPWRIISMLREWCSKLGVLIPYRCHSAATLIALGCDEIVMGRKAELGPIDPAINFITQESGTPVQQEIRIEDVMAYIAFLKEKAGLGDQAALADNIRILADKLSPWVLGSIYRTHSHIRMIARKLLGCHAERMEEQRINSIVEALAEKTYLHGHAVGRTEADDLRLPVVRADDELEATIWDLLQEYEQRLEMRTPLDIEGLFGPDADEAEKPLTIAMIESEPMCWACRGIFKAKKVRQTPSQVNINLNLGLQLPPGLDPQLVPQEAIRQIIEQVQKDIPRMVNEQARKQSPLIRTEGRLQASRWQDVTAEKF